MKTDGVATAAYFLIILAQASHCCILLPFLLNFVAHMDFSVAYPYDRHSHTLQREYYV